MNLLLITNRYPKNANDPASPFVPDFVASLERLGAKVVVLTPLYGRTPNTDEPKVYRFRFGQRDSEAPIGSWNIFSPYTWWRIHRFIHAGEEATDRLIERFAFDHVLALWALPSGWFAHHAAHKWKTPYSVWCLGSDINTWARRPFFRRLTKEILRDARHVFADGFALAKAATGLSGRPCRFLPSYRHLAESLPLATKRDSSRPYFLYSGRIHRSKGVFDLLVAFKQAGPALADFELILVGDGPESARLKSMVGGGEFARRVRVVGKVSRSQLAGYYQGAQATVIPSRSDSLPLVFSEAVQCGSPVIVYDTGDLGHFVRRFRLGTVVTPGDVQLLSEALVETAFGDRRNPAGRKAVVDLMQPMRAARKFLRAVQGVDKVEEIPARTLTCEGTVPAG